MRAAVFDEFRGPVQVRDVASPECHPDAVIVDVKACGVCRSDWHAWMGHDSDVRLPHVPGHELAGVIASVGDNVSRWHPGQRITVPFVCGCGQCPPCISGNQQVCDHQTQPGFTHWGAFADQVEIRHADLNLAALPDSVDYVTAASLGCRFATSFRALVAQGRLTAGQWVAIHGCGGVGLSAVMIAKAIGARVVAVDVREDRLSMAQRLGAEFILNADQVDIVSTIFELTRSGADVSVDALGSKVTCWNSIACLAKRGRHLQIGLMLGSQVDPPIPMSTVIAKELEIYGSHGMQAYEYPRMLGMITSGLLDPTQLISDVVSLEEGAELLMRLDSFPHAGITVIGF